MIGKGLVCASILFSSSVLSLVIHLSMLKVENYFHINFIAKELRGFFFVKSYLFFISLFGAIFGGKYCLKIQICSTFSLSPSLGENKKKHFTSSLCDHRCSLSLTLLMKNITRVSFFPPSKTFIFYLKTDFFPWLKKITRW